MLKTECRKLYDLYVLLKQPNAAVTDINLRRRDILHHLKLGDLAELVHQYCMYSDMPSVLEFEDINELYSPIPANDIITRYSIGLLFDAENFSEKYYPFFSALQDNSQTKELRFWLEYLQYVAVSDSDKSDIAFWCYLLGEYQEFLNIVNTLHDPNYDFDALFDLRCESWLAINDYKSLWAYLDSLSEDVYAANTQKIKRAKLRAFQIMPDTEYDKQEQIRLYYEHINEVCEERGYYDRNAMAHRVFLEPNYLGFSPYLRQFFNNPCPERIYHYTDLSAMISIIEKSEFWATSYEYLNDTEERRYIIDVLDEENIPAEIMDGLKYYFNLDGDSLDANQRYFVSKTLPQILGSSFIVSFSMDSDSLPLWSGYSKKDGVNIGFDPKNILINHSMNAPNPYFEYCISNPVVYIPSKSSGMRNSSNEDIKKIVEMITSIKEDAQNYGCDSLTVFKILLVHIVYLSCFIKDKVMEAEKEYRVVSMRLEYDRESPPENDESRVKFRVRNDMLIPYRVLKDDFHSSIKSITVGPTNNNPMTVKGINWLLKENFYKDVIVKTSDIKLRY